VERVRQSVSVYDVASRIISLKKVGTSFVGLSPFQNEKTPSFNVPAGKDFFKDFSSGEAGDIFKFVMLTEKVDFQEAVQMIAERHGIPIQYDGPEDQQQGATRSLRKELEDIHDLATQFFHYCFMKDDETGRFARDFWTRERGFKPETAEAYRIGFAPVDGHALYHHLIKKNFSRQSIEECGLFFTGHGKPLCRFMGRLMIPIREASYGKVVAFTGRQTSITPEGSQGHTPKYYNSPETPIFHKSKILFNLEKAKKAASADTPFYLVEGQLDAIRCGEMGIPSAVAPQGSAITDEQMMLLRRYQAPLVAVLDGDQAGQKAAIRLAGITLKLEIDTRFITLPEGQDPDTLSLQGEKKFHEIMGHPGQETAPFLADAFLGHEELSPVQQVARWKLIFEIIADCPSPLARDQLLHAMARHRGSDPVALLQDFSRWQSGKFQPRDNTSGTTNQPKESLLTKADDLILLAVSQNAELGNKICESLSTDWLDSSQPSQRILSKLIYAILHDGWKPDFGPDDYLEPGEEMEYYRRLSQLSWESETKDKELSRAIEILRQKFIRRRLEEIKTLLLQNLPSEDFRQLVLERKQLKTQLATLPEAS